MENKHKIFEIVLDQTTIDTPTIDKLEEENNADVKMISRNDKSQVKLLFEKRINLLSYMEKKKNAKISKKKEKRKEDC